jgi:hypothetical protein
MSARADGSLASAWEAGQILFQLSILEFMRHIWIVAETEYSSFKNGGSSPRPQDEKGEIFETGYDDLQ